MTIPDKTADPASVEPSVLPAGYDDYAGEIQVANGPMPRWFRRLPYLAILAGLGYYILVRAFDPVNLLFAAAFIAWMIYTPIAQKRGWFFIPM